MLLVFAFDLTSPAAGTVQFDITVPIAHVDVLDALADPAITVAGSSQPLDEAGIGRDDGWAFGDQSEIVGRRNGHRRLAGQRRTGDRDDLRAVF